MRVVRASFAAGAATLVATVIASHGCGGAAFTAGDAGAPGDAPGETAAGDARPPETGPPACILPPNGVDGEGALCDLLAARWSGCGECEACRQLDENDCVSLGQTLSVGFKSALQACAPRLGCAGDLSTLTNNPCVRAQLAATTPNAAQQAVRTAYCMACPTNITQCQSFFDLSPDAGPNAGYGIWALTLNEALDQQLASTCSGAPMSHCDAFNYGLCAALVLCGKAPHSHCPHSLCNGP